MLKPGSVGLMCMVVQLVVLAVCDWVVQLLQTAPLWVEEGEGEA